MNNYKPKDGITPSGEQKIKDMNTNEIYPVIIKCPSCDFVQGALVERTIPFGTFVHECNNCKYIIMESEWSEIKPYSISPTPSGREQEIERLQELLLDTAVKLKKLKDQNPNTP